MSPDTKLWDLNVKSIFTWYSNQSDDQFPEIMGISNYWHARIPTFSYPDYVIF